jgi:hypothetical protein
MALTKTLVFDQTVIDVLKRMTWSEDGTKGTINGQLERKLYEAVNKALAAMGGKWSRQDGGHVFDTDPRPRVEGLLETGNITVERDGFFETPEAVVKRMLELVPLPGYSGIILEPSAGNGAILRVLLKEPNSRWQYFYAIEKNFDRCANLRRDYPDIKKVNVIGGDFLEYYPTNTFDRIYMNPPFEEGQEIDHVMYAESLLATDRDSALISVMSEGPFFRGDKKATAFREWFESVGGDSEALPDGAFKESGTGVKTRLIVIRKI